MAEHREHWWKGSRGEWLVVGQFALMALVVLGPRTLGDLTATTLPFPQACGIAGPLLMVAGAVLFVFLDLKSRREEKWLADRFPGYRSYQGRVRRLVPFLY